MTNPECKTQCDAALIQSGQKAETFLLSKWFPCFSSCSPTVQRTTIKPAGNKFWPPEENYQLPWSLTLGLLKPVTHGHLWGRLPFMGWWRFRMNSHIPVTTSADKEKVLSVSTQGAGFFLWNVCWLLPMGSQLENTLYSFVTVSKLHPTPPFRVGIRELMKKKKKKKTALIWVSSIRKRGVSKAIQNCWCTFLRERGGLYQIRKL